MVGNEKKSSQQRGLRETQGSYSHQVNYKSLRVLKVEKASHKRNYYWCGSNTK